MKILITGETGFVGANLKEYIKLFHEPLRLEIRYKEGQEIKINTDAVIHLAGKAHDLRNVSIPQDYYDSNFKLTKQLFDAFLNSNAEVFIFMSTVKAVADKVEGVLTEESLPNPKTHYGISKLQAEEYILSKELPRQKRVYILRPCMIHGPGNKGNLNLLYQLVSKGLPWPLGKFQNQRSFLSIENLCFVIKELIENEQIFSGIYQVADDKSISTNELINLLGKSLDKKTIIWNINPLLIRKLGKIGDFLPFPLNSERLQKLTESYVVSNQKIINALGKQLPIKTDTGLMKTFKSFKN
ncbi:NAD-dependent epimerase/dehydratase family protein [Flavobacterium sp. FlaQc-57]|uniref:NAD-dependent epimerase/dehydratase family protein n=1 Tax=Flavobacterium sp. FlaQc-57 TaxID=3374186 RepID=UPI0037568C66